MRLFPLRRARTIAVCLVLICSASVVVSLSAHWPFAKAIAASIPSGPPDYVHATAPPAKSNVLTPFGNTITVNSTSDVANSSDGLCTLREAITAANTNSASGVTAGECVAGSSSGSDTIDLTALTGTITLTSVLPNISSAVTINGPGANVLVLARDAGAPDFRIFQIVGSFDITLSRLTISGGKDAGGGAVLNNSTGTVNVVDCTISGNTSTSTGALGNGNTGTVNITGTTVSGNSAAGNGGGISNTFTGIINIINSTISGNSARGDAGGIDVNNFGSVNVTNSTITNNRADSDGNSTGSGGGISSGGGTLSLHNTIVAGNFKGASPSTIASDIANVGGTVDSTSSFNLIGTGGSGGLTNGVNSNLVGIANPGLGPLANNGGPTQTHALLADSTAIDAGNNCVLTNSCSPSVGFALTTDQRGAGYNRSVDGNGDGSAIVDIGAYELQSLLVTNTADSGPGSLRQAIMDANVNPDTNPINFQAGLTGTITLLTALPDISTSMSINGPGANKMVVRRSTAGGTPNFRIFTIINSGNIVSISGLTISNGQPMARGAGISNSGNLTVTNCTISGNSNQDQGGGIYNDNVATLNVTHSTISGNSASDGGGLANFGALNVVESAISGNNTTTGIGGGIFASSGNTVVTNSTISGNNAAGNGGGIFSNSVLTLTNTTLSGNTATTGGGGGLITGGGPGATATLTNVTITNNHTGNLGGGALFIDGNDKLRNTIIAGNFSSDDASTNNIHFNVDTSAASFNNLIGPGETGGLTATNGNQINVANPGLGPLADNGGPTLTHALLSGSPAIDAGNNSAVTNPPFTGPPFTDQRGGIFNRIADGDGNSTAVVDIGAYELQGILTIDKVSPPAGRVSGGQQVVLAGGFANLSTVTMGGVGASWVYTNGAGDTSSITVTTPAHAVGAVQIDLTPASGPVYSKPNAFAYLPTVFTDDTLVVNVTTVKAQHIIELRQAVDAMRAVAGLGGAPWTDATLTPGSSVIKAVHILELRTYLDDAATRLGYATSPYTDPSLTVGYVIKRIHIEELRQRIRIIAG